MGIDTKRKKGPNTEQDKYFHFIKQQMSLLDIFSLSEIEIKEEEAKKKKNSNSHIIDSIWFWWWLAMKIKSHDVSITSVAL